MAKLSITIGWKEVMEGVVLKGRARADQCADEHKTLKTP